MSLSSGTAGVTSRAGITYSPSGAHVFLWG